MSFNFLKWLRRFLGLDQPTPPTPSPAPPPPAPPPVRTIAVVVFDPNNQPVQEYDVVLGSFHVANVKNPDGYHAFDSFPYGTAFLLSIIVSGYKIYQQSISVPYEANIDLVIGGKARPDQIQLPPLTPILLPLPPVPTRDQVCGVLTHFQGIYYQTQEFGRFPADFLALLNPGDFDAALATHKAAGDTHVTMDLTSAYREPQAIYPERLKNGHDWSTDLPGLKRQVRRAIMAGFFVDLALGGDGRSVNANPQPGQYNDPVGDTYGFEWLMQNIERIVKAFRGDPDSACPDGENLTRYIIFRTGYDGVFYGWGGDTDGVDRQPQRVLDFGAKFRSILPDGYLAIEHDTGHIPVGEGGAEFAHGMQAYDAIYSEFTNWPQTGDPVWQIAARLLGPAYRRPADEPASDDPRPPYYLAPGTPRGPYFAVAFEYAKFPESRGALTQADVERARQYYRNLGYHYLG